jgi:hypothetical protein
MVWQVSVGTMVWQVSSTLSTINTTCKPLHHFNDLVWSNMNAIMSCTVSQRNAMQIIASNKDANYIDVSVSSKKLY